jgi:hypothetical protein
VAQGGPPDTTNGATPVWEGPVVNDATGTTYAERPGMTTVAQLSGHLWIMTYEFGAPVDPANPDQAN